MLENTRQEYLAEGKHLIIVTPALRTFACQVHKVGAAVPDNYNVQRPNWERLEGVCNMAQTVVKL